MEKSQTKTIGLIGGMGWESSQLYYERINKEVNKTLGGSHSAKILMTSVDFAPIKKHTFNDDWDAIADLMVSHAKRLERGGADMILLCTNLIHLVSAAIAANVSIPFLHIADTTGEAINNKAIGKVLLLGTQPTMEKDFYSKILEEKYHLNVLVPNTEDRQYMQRIIYDELLNGVFLETAKQQVIEIITKGQDSGIDGVIMACTELPMLVAPNDIHIPMFDTGEIHVQKAVALAINP